ncbi:MAG: hypothetical protein WCS75_04185 [Sphingomonas sp.]|uniref:hypothetical protein n=1 Tax=Sphingomonas sp. TaxID=28214 RepID=UPI00356ADD83
MTSSIEFEPLVEFPEDPFDAARIYLSVMAYPELGAGQPGGLGVPFIAALWQYAVWDIRKARGLAALREKFRDQTFESPRKRDFEGALNRGIARLERRSAAYTIIGNQLVNGMLNGILRAQELVRDGRDIEAFVRPLGDDRPNPIRSQIIADETPSPRKIVQRDLPAWSKRLGLNTTGASADPSRKAKDLIRRGFIESRPVLHLAHGLNMILADDQDKLHGWGEQHWLLILLWNCDAWVWKALDLAIAWREVSRFSDYGLPSTEQMIELVKPKKCGIMHPAEDASSIS